MAMDEFGSLDELGMSREVTVYKNGSLSNPKVMSVPHHWTTDEFLNSASKRLNLPSTARYMFSKDGLEVEDVSIIQNKEIIFVSQSRHFRPPGSGKGKGAKGSGDGSVVGGYVVGKSLGEGGFGQVMLGKHQITGDPVALKFMSKKGMGSARAAQRVVTEIQCLVELTHPHVIRLEQVVNEPEHMVLVLEFAAGGDLRHYMTGLPSCRLDEKQARVFFRQMVSAVSYAHKHHIVHRDLKLENLLLSDGQIKVTDFGLSTFVKPGSTSKTSAGSLNYLAPETLRGTSNEGPPVDVWALGVILFAMLYGHLPFEADETKTEEEQEEQIRQRILRCDYRIPPDDSVSADAKDLIRSLLQESPEYRLSVATIFAHPWMQATHSAVAVAPVVMVVQGLTVAVVALMVVMVAVVVAVISSWLGGGQGRGVA